MGGRHCLYKSIEMGFRTLEVRFDNEWNSEIAMYNIKNITTKLDVGLQGAVADLEENKNLQVSFFCASVSEAEITTDYAV